MDFRFVVSIPTCDRHDLVITTEWFDGGSSFTDALLKTVRQFNWRTGPFAEVPDGRDEVIVIRNIETEFND